MQPMSNPRRHSLHPATWFLLLTLLTIVVSWTLDVYGLEMHLRHSDEAVRIQSLLNPEGIRWMLRNVLTNFTGFPPLGMGIAVMLGAAVARHSGFVATCLAALGLRRGRPARHISRKERRALIAALLVGALYLAVILVATFSPLAILRGIDGKLAHSPFLDGSLFLLVLGVGLMSLTYGISIGRYRTDEDFLAGIRQHFRLPAEYILITIPAAQWVACMHYAHLDIYLHGVIHSDLLWMLLLLCLAYYKKDPT
jgi:aminobenzoyl-glutamate transport protein